jgi:hypothetical protein
MADDAPEHDMGVDFTDLNPVLEEVSYPVTTDELREQYGDTELGRTNADPITLKKLFDYMGDETFESPDGVRQQILSQMPRNSEGRPNYSDRGGSTPVQTDEAEEAERQTAGDLQDGPATDTDTTQQ